jgi:hypothetical protein
MLAADHRFDLLDQVAIEKFRVDPDPPANLIMEHRGKRFF